MCLNKDLETNKILLYKGRKEKDKWSVQGMLSIHVYCTCQMYGYTITVHFIVQYSAYSVSFKNLD